MQLQRGWNTGLGGSGVEGHEAVTENCCWAFNIPHLLTSTDPLHDA